MGSLSLTFFCELDSQALGELFEDLEIIATLEKLNASISLGMLDFSPTRADVVRKLNRAGIPVTAWLLLPKQEGYWFNADNYPESRRRYREFREWTDKNHLSWAAVGLDIEPDIRDLQERSRDRVGFTRLLLMRAFNRKRLSEAHSSYSNLVELIHSDGYFVESYQLPIIADERLVESSLLKRITGIVDVPVDREVWMLYTSFLRRYGAGMLWSYAPEAEAIGLGSTGGGVDAEFGNFAPLTWDELARDLRLAWYWNNHLYIFSLEGCAENGYLTKLKDFTWDIPILFPEEAAQNVRNWRRILQSTLWVMSHLPLIMGIAIGLMVLLRGVRRWNRRESV